MASMNKITKRKEGKVTKHEWIKVDKDDRWKKKGRKWAYRNVKEVCRKCGKERVRKITKRVKY